MLYIYGFDKLPTKNAYGKELLKIFAHLDIREIKFIFRTVSHSSLQILFYRQSWTKKIIKKTFKKNVS